MQGFLCFVYLAITLAMARPSNDWSTPCFNGECAYDLLEGGKNGYGSVKIFGSPASITDITPAAGWVILDCDKNSLEQEIRLVCQGDDSACNHLFDHNGPAGKLVRLPEECGAGPFARIAEAKLAEDQGVPAHVQSKLLRRASGEPARVHILKVDVNFAAIDPTKTGTVSFAVVGANFPVGLLPEETTHLHARDIDGLFDSIKKGFNSAVNAVKDVANKVTTFNANPKITKSLDFQQHLDLLNLRQTCGPVSLSLDVGVDGKAHADISAGLVAAGTIIPPKLDRFGAFAGLSADIEAQLHVDAKLQGTIDTGRKQLVKLTVPGFDIAGIISAGPMLVVDGQVIAQLDLSLALDVGIGYRLDGVELWVPSSAGPSLSKGVRPKDTPVKLSAGANVNANGDIQGHLIPSVRLGVEGLGGIVKVDAYLEVDAYAKLHLNGQASVATARRDIGAQAYVPPYGSYNLAHRSAQVNDAAAFSGCLDLKAGVAINGGADGKIPIVADISKKITIFSKEFQVLKKCWNGGVARRQVSQWNRGSVLVKRAADLGPVCPKSPTTAADLAPVDSETVSASAIQ